jgi:hypothetical protein
MLILAVGFLVAAVSFVVLTDAWPESGTAQEAVPTTIRPSTTTTVPPTVQVSTQLATPIGGEIQAYDAPNGKPLRMLGFWYGYPITTPILEERDGWMQVRLPERPNMATGWVRASEVTVTSTDYRIVINLATTTVIVYKAGYEAFRMPAGLGKASTPTPPGNYYVGVIEKPGPPGYGPIVLDLTAHSEAIQSWEGSGDAIIALHGPISASSDAKIGTTGTYISNGCVRLHEVDQLKLDVIPLGTPVDIVTA